MPCGAADSLLLLMRTRYAPALLSPSPVPRGRRVVLRGIADNPRRWEAYALIASGILSAAGILLYHQGKRGAASALGVFAALGASVIGAVRILASSE